MVVSKPVVWDMKGEVQSLDSRCFFGRVSVLLVNKYGAGASGRLGRRCQLPQVLRYGDRTRLHLPALRTCLETNVPNLAMSTSLGNTSSEPGSPVCLAVKLLAGSLLLSDLAGGLVCM